MIEFTRTIHCWCSILVTSAVQEWNVKITGFQRIERIWNFHALKTRLSTMKISNMECIHNFPNTIKFAISTPKTVPNSQYILKSSNKKLTMYFPNMTVLNSSIPPSWMIESTPNVKDKMNARSALKTYILYPPKIILQALLYSIQVQPRRQNMLYCVKTRLSFSYRIHAFCHEILLNKDRLMVYWLGVSLCSSLCS